MALFLVLSVIRIKVTTRVQLVVGIATVAVIVLVDLITTAKGGSHGQALGAFSFSHTNSGGFNGVFYGIIFGVTSYIGFETAADFGEETAHPRRYIPIAVLVATLFAIVLYLWTTYSITIGYGVNNGAKMGADPGRAEDHGDHVRRLLARHAGRDRRHARRVHRVRRLRDRRRRAPCSRWAARACCPPRSAAPTRGSRRRSTRRWPSPGSPP